ncbi:MAG: hypothetical protein SGILL_009896, partial [Bacillariaceae sp.]
AQPDRNLMNAEGEIFDAQVGYFGVSCPEESPFYSESDRLWSLSQLFFYISLGLGGVTTLFAWALTFCVPPTGCRWRSLSVFAAITAVMEVPIFLLFESDTCNLDVNRQTCKLAMGAYMNMLSVILWAVMTIWIQCLNTPQWAEEINAWKVNDAAADQNSNSSTSSKGGPDGPKSFYTTESEEDSFPYPHPAAQRRQRGDNNNNKNNMRSANANEDSRYEHDLQLYDEAENDPELAWASMNSAQRRAMEQNIRASQRNSNNRNRDTFQEADLEEAATRDASCMERILARNGGGKKSRSKRRSNNAEHNPAVIGCSSLTIDENSQDILQGAAATVMQSLSGNSGDGAVCRGFDIGPDNDSNGNDRCTASAANQTASQAVTKSTVSSYSTQANFEPFCPANVNVNCVAQQAAQLPAAVAACILPECEEEQVMEREFATATMHSSNEARPRADSDEDATNDIDYLTKRMRSDINALANGGGGFGGESKSKVAPVQTIHVDTSYVDEQDANDEMSEMTRGSGVASGVSEVLDTDRRLLNNDDPMTILDDLARTY